MSIKKRDKQMRKLKIAILIDDTKLANFQVQIIKQLEESKWCDKIIFIKKQKSRDLYEGKSKYLFFRLILKLDEKIFAKNTPYLQEKSIKEFIKDDNLIEIKTKESEYFDTIKKQDINKIKDLDIDVMLNFNFKYIVDDLLKAARYGIWEYFSDNRPPAFWEVIENKPYTEVKLQTLGSAFECGYVLDSFKTVTHQKSMLKNYEQIMWRSHMMVIHNLKRLSIEGKNYFLDKKVVSYFYDLPRITKHKEKKLFDFQFKFSDDRGKKPPSNFDSLRVVCRLIAKYAKFGVRRFFKMDRWIILFSENKNGKINPDFSSYKRLPLPSNDYFQADPFVIDEGDESYLFFEELDYKTLKGYLLVARYDKNRKTFVEPKEILRREYHLSYPHVFKVENQYYMVVESHENLTIDLYKAESFPTRWTKVKSLMKDIKAVDATLHKKDGKWWMFVNIAAKEGFSLNDELYIYYSDDFRSDEWISHPLNPVISDVTRARPGGNLIEKEGRLFRPAQNCSGVYGRGLVINEILELDETNFKERVIQQIRADFADDLVAVHTFNTSKRFSVIDAIKSR